ncbi:MAG: antibiotic biosynthesis monooxygenase [Deltaproteobacteria bacterium]|jgi:heme-degrading monooxygenase HmoA|nr:antibiotic biosynthesis monooxygenase [Deltaproteobacteria bacterium]
MIAVIFEVTPTKQGKQEYLEIAACLREHLINMPGFISVERFQSLTEPEKLLSLSFWEDEDSISKWRNLEEHRNAQSKGRDQLFKDYRIRVCNVTRDYTLTTRSEAPSDSNDIYS